MTPENFCYWLHGYLFLTKSNRLGKTQVKRIKTILNAILCEHLDGESDELDELLKGLD